MGNSFRSARPWVGSRGRFVSGDLRRMDRWGWVIEGHSLSSYLFLTYDDACASNVLQLVERCEHVSTQAKYRPAGAWEPGVRNAEGFKLGSPRLLDVISPIWVFQTVGGREGRERVDGHGDDTASRTGSEQDSLG